MRVVITGGAGFIGCNAASYYLSKNADVVIFDNLSRLNTEKNIDWLHSLLGNLTFIKGDIRSEKNVATLMSFLPAADAVLHLAAQVAVTTSVENPREDFEVNALGTVNLLEAMRTSKSRAKFIYSSTNKVYGSMEDLGLVEKPTRYMYSNLPYGISEDCRLDFHSPYGCSKGAADQYVHDYGRMYGLDTVVMRQSCIYGPRQFGIEDQGWVAWFVIAAVLGKKFTIYGDGKQVRDLLFVDDLIRAYDLSIRARDKTRGGVYNIGGGSDFSVSVWKEFGPMIERITGKKISVTSDDWRPGDQKVFISDIRRAKIDFGWIPLVSPSVGITNLYDWVVQNKQLFT